MHFSGSPRYIAAYSLFSTILFIFSPPTFARHGIPPTSSIQTLTTRPAALKELPAVDVQLRLAEDAKSSQPGPLRFAVPVTVDITPETEGTWEQLAEGTQLWRLRFTASGATDLNFGFTRFWLPAGARLYVRSESEDYYEGPYTEQDNKPHGQLWIPVVPGDRAVIELYVPTGRETEVELRLT